MHFNKGYLVLAKTVEFFNSWQARSRLSIS